MKINWKAVTVLAVLAGAALMFSRRANAATAPASASGGFGGVSAGGGGAGAAGSLASILGTLTPLPAPAPPPVAVSSPEVAGAAEVESRPVREGLGMLLDVAEVNLAGPVGADVYGAYGA